VLTERTQPNFALGEPDPAVTCLHRKALPLDRLGTRLTGIAGLYAGHVFPLVGEVNLIGRDAECSVSLHNDKTASRLHARIVLEDAGHVLYDQGSANGTYVNGALVRTCLLAPGDTLQCGSTRLRYE